ncbi:hypothetical protein BH23VER1_BH23VER1_15860 [soil metagenome]
MRGFPLVATFAVVVGLAAVAAVMARLTGVRSQFAAAAVAPAGAGAEPAAVAGVPVRATLTFAHPPSAFALRHLGEVVWEEAAPGGQESEAELRLPFGEAAGGIDLVLEASWAPGTPRTAIGLGLEPESLDSRGQTVWVDAGAPALFTFTWGEGSDE